MIVFKLIGASTKNTSFIKIAYLIYQTLNSKFFEQFFINVLKTL